MPDIINPALIGNWENWLRLFLIAAIGFVVVHYALKARSNKEGK